MELLECLEPPPSPVTTSVPPFSCNFSECSHGGTCEELLTPTGDIQYRCLCPPRYTGQTCDQGLCFYVNYY